MSCRGVSKRVRSPSSANRRHRHCELDTAQGLEGLDDGLEAPGLDLLVQFVFQTLEAFGLFGHGLDIFLKDNLLRGGGTNHFTEPTQVGRAPIGSPRIADIVPE